MTRVKSTTYYNPLPTAWCLSVWACDRVRERESFLTMNLIPQQPRRLKAFWNSAHVSPSFDPVLSMQHLKVSRQQRSKKRSPVWSLWISSSWLFLLLSSSWKAPVSPVCARDRLKETLITEWVPRRCEALSLGQKEKTSGKRNQFMLVWFRWQGFLRLWSQPSDQKARVILHHCAV